MHAFLCAIFIAIISLCTEHKKEIDTVSATLVFFLFFFGGGGGGKIDMMHTVQSE